MDEARSLVEDQDVSETLPVMAQFHLDMFANASTALEIRTTLRG